VVPHLTTVSSPSGRLRSLPRAPFLREKIKNTEEEEEIPFFSDYRSSQEEATKVTRKTQAGEIVETQKGAGLIISALEGIKKEKTGRPRAGRRLLHGNWRPKEKEGKAYKKKKKNDGLIADHKTRVGKNILQWTWG